MGVFYAFAKCSDSRYEGSYRTLIVFANRETADEWWRAVSTSTGANGIYAKNIKRVAPQLYLHNPAISVNIVSTITTANVADQFNGKVFFTDLGSYPAPPVPSLDITDHISGHYFFIRSKVDPGRYWYCPPSSSGSIVADTNVYASYHERTLFRVRITSGTSCDCGNRCTTNCTGSVMINSDETDIEIDGFHVTTQTSGILQVARASGRFKFRDFKASFKVVNEPVSNSGSGNCQCAASKDVKSIVYENGKGEEWELAA
ncbi:hypothetical protein M422DRAFT_247522 [Sphaerobolus stellatus SS14]|nr:hypothetical protein M422DRAFT_247522 [Sphaerobolus stellatus SS14]